MTSAEKNLKRLSGLNNKYLNSSVRKIKIFGFYVKVLFTFVS